MHTTEHTILQMNRCDKNVLCECQLTFTIDICAHFMCVVCTVDVRKSVEYLNN